MLIISFVNCPVLLYRDHGHSRLWSRYTLFDIDKLLTSPIFLQNSAGLYGDWFSCSFVCWGYPATKHLSFSGRFLTESLGRRQRPTSLYRCPKSHFLSFAVPWKLEHGSHSLWLAHWIFSSGIVILKQLAQNTGIGP